MRVLTTTSRRLWAHAHNDGRHNCKEGLGQTHLQCLVEAVIIIFSDVITPDSELILQLKSKVWKDADSIINEAIVRAVVKQEPLQVRLPLFGSKINLTTVLSHAAQNCFGKRMSLGLHFSNAHAVQHTTCVMPPVVVRRRDVVVSTHTSSLTGRWS